MADGSCTARVAASRLPSSNRGVSEFRKGDEAPQIAVSIDWLSASVDLVAVLGEQGAIGHAPSFDGRKRLLDGLEDGTTALEVSAHVFAFFFAGCGLELADKVGGGRFYKSRVVINDSAGDMVGMLEMGGAATVRVDGTFTCRLELTGKGCGLYGGACSDHAKRWLELRAKLESVAGRLTRVDIAADDLQGLHPVRMAMEWLEAGQFDSRGQKVKRQLIDDFDSGDGKTLYIGSRTSEKFMRVYEKGRELGDRESPWVRYEGEFKASTRKELPLDMLRDPAAYLLGGYPVLKFILAMAQRIDVTKATDAATWKSCRRHLKRQYGATLSFILKHSPDADALQRVVETLTSPKLPKWSGNSAANSWPEILAVNLPAKGQNQ